MVILRHLIKNNINYYSNCAYFLIDSCLLPKSFCFNQSRNSWTILFHLPCLYVFSSLFESSQDCHLFCCHLKGIVDLKRKGTFNFSSFFLFISAFNWIMILYLSPFCSLICLFILYLFVYVHLIYTLFGFTGLRNRQINFLCFVLISKIIRFNFILSSFEWTLYCVACLLLFFSLK